MHYFFFDAAGDPGFQVGKEGGGSKPFYVSCVIATENKLAIQDRIAALRQRFGLKAKFEFKYHNLDTVKRVPFFAEFAKSDMDFKAYVSVLDKQNSLSTLSLSNLGGNVLTSRLLAPLIGQAVALSVRPVNKLRIVIDQKKNDKAIADAMRAAISNELKSRGLICSSRVSPVESHTEGCLQLADMVAGMIMDKFKSGNEGLYKIMENKILLTLV
jgi:hypothetical protein